MQVKKKHCPVSCSAVSNRWASDSWVAYLSQGIAAENCLGSRVSLFHQFPVGSDNPVAEGAAQFRLIHAQKLSYCWQWRCLRQFHFIALGFELGVSLWASIYCNEQTNAHFTRHIQFIKRNWIVTKWRTAATIRQIVSTSAGSKFNVRNADWTFL